MALLLAHSSGDYNKQVLSMIGLIITFIISLYMHKHFFPLFIGAIGCWLTAASQELYSDQYVYLPSTRMFWTLGNILLPLGVADFIYRLIYKYKIVENEKIEPK